MDELATIRFPRRLGGDKFCQLLPELERLIVSCRREFCHQSVQTTSNATDGPFRRYWAWRFGRLDDPVGQEDSWGKSQTQAVSDLETASLTDATLGLIGAPTYVELAVDPYFPNTVGTVDPALKGRTIHAGGRCRVFLDDHVQFYPRCAHAVAVIGIVGSLLSSSGLAVPASWFFVATCEAGTGRNIQFISISYIV